MTLNQKKKKKKNETNTLLQKPSHAYFGCYKFVLD